MKLEDYKITKNEWDHLHDVVLDATWENGKVSLNQEEMEKLFMELPDSIKADVQHWGISDTPTRDKIYVWYQKNKI